MRKTIGMGLGKNIARQVDLKIFLAWGKCRKKIQAVEKKFLKTSWSGQKNCASSI